MSAAEVRGNGWYGSSNGAIARVPDRSAPEGMLVQVAEMMLEGATAAQIARKLKITNLRATALKDELYERVWGRVKDRYTPEVLEAMKQENSEALSEEVQNCRDAVNRSFEDGKPNTRPYGHMNVAVSLHNKMHGFNAPMQIETTDRKLYSLLKPAVHARIMSTPEGRAALCTLEELASDASDLDPGVIDVSPQGRPEGGDD